MILNCWTVVGMKILISGFEPFGGMTINPTEALVHEITRIPFAGAEIYGTLLPVNYDECVRLLIEEVERVQPDVVISCGLAAGRTAITPERIAINVKDTGGEHNIGDNRGEKPVDVPIVEGGPDGLFATLPIRTIVNRLKEAGIPAQISNTAGTFICNNTMYGLLHYIRERNLPIQAGFIHFPASTELSVQKPSMPGLPQSILLDGLKVIVETVIGERKGTTPPA